MAFSRYENRNTKNANPLYDKHLEKRDINRLLHYTTPKFDYNLLNSNPEFEVQEYIWKYGDRLSKLAQVYYSDPSLWWIIAYVNQKPTDHHYNEGDIIIVPFPPGKVIEFMGL